MSSTTAPPLPVSHCSICGSGALRRFSFGEHDLARCGGCGAVLSTWFDDPAVAYDDRYHTGESGRFIDTDHPAFQAYLARCNRERMAALRRIVAPPGRLLDIGCARGDLLMAAVADGWSVTGVEPVASAAAVGRDHHALDIRTGTLDTVRLPDSSYDVVCAFHITEHVPDVTAFLTDVRRLLRPGGVVLLEVPNWRSVSRRHFGHRWPHLHPGDHITHFTPSTLRDALGRAGLELRSLQSPSYTGEPQDLEQSAADLCLGRAARLLRPLSAMRDGRRSTAAGRLFLRAVDQAYSRLRVGVVLLAVASGPT